MQKQKQKQTKMTEPKILISISIIIFCLTVLNIQSGRAEGFIGLNFNIKDILNKKQNQPYSEKIIKSVDWNYNHYGRHNTRSSISNYGFNMQGQYFGLYAQPNGNVRIGR